MAGDVRDAGPTIDDLGDRTIDQLSSTRRELATASVAAVAVVGGKPHLIVEAVLPSGPVRVGVPLTVELVAFLGAALGTP